MKVEVIPEVTKGLQSPKIKNTMQSKTVSSKYKLQQKFTGRVVFLPVTKAT